MRDYSKNDEEKQKKRKIIIRIIIIILLLLLITCCTSKFWGTIGDLFKNHGHWTVDPDTNDKTIITNEELKFDTTLLQISLSDTKPKLSFTYTKIIPEGFTCTTSDAEIATCYVADGYVVINPKKTGSVTVTLQTETNGKIYRATANVQITDATKGIHLASKFGTMNLIHNNRMNISYTLSGLPDDVKVSSSDDSIAVVSKKANGLIEVVGLKTGKVTITLEVTYNGKTYQESYTLTITKEQTTNPENPDQPNVPTPPIVEPEKDSNTTLKEITVNGNLINGFNSSNYDYSIGVDENTNLINIDAIAASSKARNIKYTYCYQDKCKEVSSLKDLKLEKGDNVITVTVTAEDGTIGKPYTITINKASSKNNQLSDIKILSPDGLSLNKPFSPEDTNYTITVPATVDKITLQEEVSDSRSKVKYFVNGKEADLTDIGLISGETTKVEIQVTSEDGITRTYTVNVYRESSDNNFLSNITSSFGHTLNETFDKTKNDYTMTVDYNTPVVSLDAIKEDSTSSITCKLNGKDADLSNLILDGTDNKVEIIVTSESGKVNTYVVDIHRPLRTIHFEKDSYMANIEDKTISIPYKVYEDGNLITEYPLDDITIECGSATCDKQQGYINVPLTPDMINQNNKISASYLDEKAETTLNVGMGTYHISSVYKGPYDIDYIDGVGGEKTISIDTNLNTFDMNPVKIDNGVRIYLQNSTHTYIDITSDNGIVDIFIPDDSETSGIPVKIVAKQAGNTTIHVTGTAYNQPLKDTLNIEIRFNGKYIFTIDANGGFFDAFTIKHQETVDKGSSVSLADYNPYKVNIEANCEYYKLASYNTSMDGNGTSYAKDYQFENIDQSITVYAIYENTSEYIELPEIHKLYLTDVDLFHNDEYFKVYGKDKIIYPGAMGSYKMTIENNQADTITIKGITLEEDTICVPYKGGKGCLNMGYFIRYSAREAKDFTYFYGDSDKYAILNKDSLTTFNNLHTKRIIPFTGNEITIPKGDGVDIYLFWRWEEVNDELDTLIGKEATKFKEDGKTLNDKYSLTVSIDFDSTNKYCKPKG